VKIAAIGEEDTIIGLRLAGIGDAFIASEVSEIKAAIEKVLQNPDIGLLIITERLAEKVRNIINEIMERRTIPTIIEIPDRQGPIEREVDPISELIKRAVGVKLK
jgi:V/A-type H+-transporting ATPase subunit F